MKKYHPSFDGTHRKNSCTPLSVFLAIYPHPVTSVVGCRMWRNVLLLTTVARQETPRALSTWFLSTILEGRASARAQRAESSTTFTIVLHVISNIRMLVADYCFMTSNLPRNASEERGKWCAGFFACLCACFSCICASISTILCDLGCVFVWVLWLSIPIFPAGWRRYSWKNGATRRIRQVGLTIAVTHFLINFHS